MTVRKSGSRKRNGNSRKSKKHSVAADVFRLIYAVIVLIAAIIIVFFVFNKVKDISGFGNILSGDQEVQSAEYPQDDLSSFQGNKGEDKNNIVIDDEVSGLNVSEEGTVYLKDDGSYAKEEWISQENSLYYFDENGFAVKGKIEEAGETITFDDEGKVVSIKYNPDYVAKDDESTKDYNSLVKSKTLWAYLSEDKSLGEFDVIMYKKTTEARSYVLGGEENPQFTSPFSIQIDGGVIYYLPLSDNDKLSSEEKKINGTLYRMKPGAENREIVAQNVEGYKVVSGRVFYMTNGKIYSTESAVKDETKTVYIADSIDLEDFSFEKREGSLYLCDKEGNPVNISGGSKRVGSFTYKINENGEILGVRDKTSVTTGGWTYYTVTDGSTGKNISKIVRKDETGRVQEVSADFPGQTGNMFYDYSSGNLVAEYMPGSDSCRLIIINENGDVDVASSTLAVVSDMKLYVLTEGEAICKVGYDENKFSFENFDLSLTTPIAAGVISENIFLESGEEASEENVTEIPVQTVAPVETVAPSEASSGENGTGGDGIIVGGAPD